MQTQRDGAEYSCALSLTSALDGDVWKTPRPSRFTARKKDPVATVQMDGWAPVMVFNSAGKCRLHQGSNPEQASSGNSLPTFQYNLSVPTSWVKNPIGCHEMSVRNYHYSLRNSPEERSCHIFRGGSLKLRK